MVLWAGEGAAAACPAQGFAAHQKLLRAAPQRVAHAGPGAVDADCHQSCEHRSAHAPRLALRLWAAHGHRAQAHAAISS